MDMNHWYLSARGCVRGATVFHRDLRMRMGEDWMVVLIG